MSMCKIASLLCLLFLLFALPSWGDRKMPEIRAMWVARWDITSPEACRTLVKLAKDYNLNALFVQVRGRGDALYKSRYEPRCQFLDNQSPDFDPLGLILKEGHEAGLQIHAWINANYTWDSATPPRSPEHIVNKHPDWLMCTNENEVTMTGGDDVEGAYTCPSNEEFREFLKNVYLDVATSYDVDGVHFDFIRYPSIRYCYCERCLGKFKAQIDKTFGPEVRLALANNPDGKGYTFACPRAWDDFRREQITKTVYAVYDAVKAVRPRIVVSAAVFPNFDDACNWRFQDWKRWLKDRKLDLLCPMAYSKDTDTFARNIKDAVDSGCGVPICAGIGAWQIPAESTVEKVRKARELGAAGVCLFSYGVTKEGRDAAYLEALRGSVFTDTGYLPLVGTER